MRELWREDLLPYRELRDELPMIMVNHAAYPETPGKNMPASVSPYWITTVLRKRIGYRGIIFSDDMEMGGILKFMPIEEAAIAAIRAGMDMIEICHSPELILRAYEALIAEGERSAAFAKLLIARAEQTARQRARLFASRPSAAADSQAIRCAASDGFCASAITHQRRAQEAHAGMSAKTMTVAGIMSGTSADGIDVAVVRIAPGRQRPRAHAARPRRLRISRPAAPRRLGGDECGVNFDGRAGAPQLAAGPGLCRSSASDASSSIAVKLDLIGCHGQTLYHQPRAASYAGRRFACTWQAGEAAVIARALGVPVVSNFRPADMLAGGQGAPLVPLLDYVLFADAKRGRVLQNIGGIANLTAIPAGAGAGRGDRLRHRSRQHGDRCAGAAAIRQEIRPQRSHRRAGHGACSQCWTRLCAILTSN